MTQNIQDKKLDIKNVQDLKEKTPDVKIVGDGNLFQLLSKASSTNEGWYKSTKAMEILNNGCVVQATSYFNGNCVAEALTFVPGVKIVDDVNGGKKLVNINS